jgi:hypothetical protein
LGITTAGQRTSESVGGGQERNESIRHTRDLLLRRIIEATFVALWVPLITGPWCLILYVPRAVDCAVRAVSRWLGWGAERTRAEEYTYRISLTCIGIAVGLGLFVLDDAALCWWPWRWQIARTSLRGLLWPGWWRAAIPSFVILRAIAVFGPLRAWSEVAYLDARQRQEIVMPTLSGVAFSTPDPHDVNIPGVPSFHRDPQAPAAPPSEVRAIFRLEPSNGNGHGTTRIVNCPDDVATLEQLRDLANLALDYDVRPTRAQIVTKRHLFTDAAWRAFQAWMLEQGLVTKSSTSQNAPYELTRDGHQWLRTIQEGQAEQAF